jgi:hypothetical protein
MCLCSHTNDGEDAYYAQLEQEDEFRRHHAETVYIDSDDPTDAP